jgi:glucans biosynthesis protein
MILCSRLARRASVGFLAQLLLGLLLGAAVGPPIATAFAFDLDDVATLAQQMAKEPYRNRQRQVPDWMRVGSLTYDQWRDIRFRPDRALWRAEKLPFQVQLFHPGLYFERSVKVNTVDASGAHELPYSARFFDYGKNDFAAKIPADIGWAGIRIHAPLRSPEYFDELIVFLGASYFRALGRDNVYGLSARGLAIDTVERAARSSRTSSSTGWSSPSRTRRAWCSTPCSTARPPPAPTASRSPPAWRPASR